MDFPVPKPDQLKVLVVPYGLGGCRLPVGCVEVSRGESPDIVVLAEHNSLAVVQSRLGPARAAIVPIVDASRHVGLSGPSRGADLVLGTLSEAGLDNGLRLLEGMVQRMRDLPSSVFQSNDSRMILLARLVVREGCLSPRRDANCKDTVSWCDGRLIPNVTAAAERLAESGLLERHFFDMITVCPYCESGRLSVSERCGTCASSNLVEQPVIHHMTCAYQGPEEDFRKEGEWLRCPKCLQYLGRFGIDYDRPGKIIRCRSCGTISGDADVHFLCLDCGMESDARNIATREIFSYRVTDAGRAAVFNGFEIGAATDPEADATSCISQFAEQHRACATPFCLLVATLHAPAGIADNGRQWKETLSFFGARLQETFDRKTEIISERSTFYVLLSGDTKAEVLEGLPMLRGRLEPYLTLAPDISYEVKGPEDLLLEA